jgi:hypothetical protein
MTSDISIAVAGLSRHPCRRAGSLGRLATVGAHAEKLTSSTRRRGT